LDNTEDTKTINWMDMERAYEESIVPGCQFTRTLTQLNNNYRIVCGIVVKNRTNMELSSPRVTIKVGSLIRPPPSVAPRQTESMVITLFHVCNIDMLTHTFK
jgi:hypothetical protein